MTDCEFTRRTSITYWYIIFIFTFALCDRYEFMDVYNSYVGFHLLREYFHCFTREWLIVITSITAIVVNVYAAAAADIVIIIIGC